LVVPVDRFRVEDDRRTFWSEAVFVRVRRNARHT
jgi:hypothetical protein